MDGATPTVILTKEGSPAAAAQPADQKPGRKQARILKTALATYRDKLPWFLPALIVLVTIFYLSSQHRVPTAGFDVQFVAMFGHLIAYGILAVALLLALQRAGFTARNPALWAFCGAVVYGLTDEVHQYFVPGRRADPVDLIINGAGAALFLWVYLRVCANPRQSFGRRVLTQSRRRP